MKRPIGYYVHHQGAGHRHRARLVAAVLDRRCTLLGTFGDAATEFGALPFVDLPDDRIVRAAGLSGVERIDSLPEAFHYAPLGVPGPRRRMAMIAAWIEANDPALMVVDVSVEVALFARLMAVPTAVVRLAGARIDKPHLEAFRAADTILAPFPEIFEAVETPIWVRDKTFYGGFLAPAVPIAPNRLPVRTIALVLGQGGTRVAANLVAEAARVTPDMQWNVYGMSATLDSRASNLTFHGWQLDLGEALAAADLVIGGAGDGLVADVAARAKRFICLPEDRPFDEQRDKARVLASLSLALVLEAWPDPSYWPALLQQVGAIDPLRLHRLADAHAIQKFGAAIEMAAGRYD